MSSLSHIARPALLLAALAAPALAQPVLITAPQTISATQTTITPTAGGSPVPLSTAQVTVQGTTLTINGRHAIGTLDLVNFSTLTHSPATSFDYSGSGTDVVYGQHLIIAGALTIDSGSVVEVSGLGFPSGQGPGAGLNGTPALPGGSGGSYGGSGGPDAAFGGPAVGNVYGAYQAPAQFGSGSGSIYYAPTSQSYAGGAGGGAVHLQAGTIAMNGVIHANGYSGPGTPAGYYSGAAGGSVWLSAITISGAGLIEASGAYGNTGAHGGGGRILLQSNNTYAGPVRALPGGGSAGPGTITTILNNGNPTVTYAGGGVTELVDPLAITGALIIRDGAFLSHRRNGNPLAINITGDLTIGAASGIDVSGRGFPSGSGPGAGQTGTLASNGGGGGSHGGSGGNDITFGGGLAGPTYGSFASPTTFGSGGGGIFYPPTSQAYAGGAGGGAVRLQLSGALTLDGVIRANGTGSAGTPAGYYSGGAGGSIWVSASSISGAATGAIEADGGYGNTGAHGGGGRIALDYATNTLSTTHAYAPAGGAGPGSIYLHPSTGASTLKYSGSGITSIGSLLTVPGNLVIDNGAYLAAPQGVTLAITVAGAATFAVNSGIDLSGRGYPGGQGPGAGQSGTITNNGGGGGSYGGSGAPDLVFGGANPGVTYGSFAAPTDYGSGGGAVFYPTNSTAYAGGAGGGALRLQVAGVLTVPGIIRSNGVAGAPTPPGYYSAGSGGSLWITAGSLTGAGAIEANGGYGNTGAHGGGGRVALQTSSGNTFTGTASAYAAAGGAGPGTVYTVNGASPPTLKYAGSGITAVVSPLTLTGNLVTDAGAYISSPRGTPLVINIAGNATFNVNSGINLNGKGFAGGQGPGAGRDGSAQAEFGGGGGYGGAGATSFSGVFGGITYGSLTQPADLGSGGGANFYAPNGQTYAGGPGGGALRLDVTGSLTDNGLISANGDSGPATPAGYYSAGSGGSLWISAGSIAGSGAIAANGGYGNNAGHGGGGRVAIYSCNFTLNPANVTAATYPNGQPGTVHFDTATGTIDPPIACVNATITLRVAGPNLGSGVQWRRNHVPLEDGPTPRGSFITGSHTPTLTIINAAPGDDGRYDAVIPGACGGLSTNESTLTINSADFNNDDDIGTDQDIEAFFRCLAGNCCPICDSVDFDGDGDIGTDHDIETFFRVLAGGGCN